MAAKLYKVKHKDTGVVIGAVEAANLAHFETLGYEKVVDVAEATNEIEALRQENEALKAVTGNAGDSEELTKALDEITALTAEVNKYKGGVKTKEANAKIKELEEENAALKAGGDAGQAEMIAALQAENATLKGQVEILAATE